ncbi:hypothetical protein BOO71_0013549 [Deinococcus marmoris]|uniref:Uncharacterized protein n=1 Tax=Deinococcus marmoris TaxID=249408 RepID=A0A1U7NSN4_9DEIO|nr:hypothetical protein BOO71_0013549 [Deinococcus marmoris]
MAGLMLAPLVLAGLGLTHPHHLRADTATHWTAMHLALMPVFPLLGVNLWWLLSGVSGHTLSGVLAWVARVLAFVYIVYYGALDVLAGVGTGRLTLQGQDASAIRLLFAEGNALAAVGVWAFLGASLLTCGLLMVRHGVRLWPGAVLLMLSSVSFLSSHIYAPYGVLTMLVMGLGMALLFGLQSPPKQPGLPAQE